MDENNSEKSLQGRTNEPVSIQNTPLALGCIMDDVAEIREKLDFLSQHLGIGAAGTKPVTIKEAAEFLSSSESKIRRLVREHSIPFYRRGGITYFFLKKNFWNGSRKAGSRQLMRNLKTIILAGEDDENNHT